jgi:hypothetical protein
MADLLASCIVGKVGKAVVQIGFRLSTKKSGDESPQSGFWRRLKKRAAIYPLALWETTHLP